ncbi:hypothetical protein SAMN05421578_109202 [Paenibacillus macquariensis]|uniref:Uncharacterized protein n=1 Tax=Paenibacillus macquariensis TaxID=948756 RepID=A0ABY1K4U9_9BACL|nr:hypothetical protein SAMN05421578_109202 [Paenibacillus macquariensis]
MPSEGIDLIGNKKRASHLHVMYYDVTSALLILDDP